MCDTKDPDQGKDISQAAHHDCGPPCILLLVLDSHFHCVSCWLEQAMCLSVSTGYRRRCQRFMLWPYRLHSSRQAHFAACRHSLLAIHLQMLTLCLPLDTCHDAGSLHRVAFTRRELLSCTIKVGYRSNHPAWPQTKFPQPLQCNLWSVAGICLESLSTECTSCMQPSLHGGT